MRIGILMGGPSREREISFAGGRTVYDNLDKSLFEPFPIFIDSFGSPILLDWQYVYKGTIRDFFPPTASLPTLDFPAQLYIEHIEGLSEAQYAQAIASVGRRLTWEELPKLIDFAFLTLHGAMGEDGAVQGMLEWLGIPYSGCGVLGAAVGIDKIKQRAWLPKLGFAVPAYTVVQVPEYEQTPQAVIERVKAEVGFPCVLKHPTQGSSIGVRIARSEEDFHEAFVLAAFEYVFKPTWWASRTREQQIEWIKQQSDPREGIGLPVYVITPTEQQLVRQPDHLYKLLNGLKQEVLLRAPDAPTEILVERFIDGEEFSVIVIENSNGTPLALPPTQIIKGQAMYDYRSKYLPGLSRKITPIDLPEADIRRICHDAESLMDMLFFNVYCRIDGILAKDGTIYFNDPNTTSGMLPGSFFFHQASEIGLNPSQFLTYIIHASLRARVREGKLAQKSQVLLGYLGQLMRSAQAEQTEPLHVGVVLGGYSSERHISVESGRNVFEKLSSTPGYKPIPLFLLHNKLLTAEQLRILGAPTEFPFTLWYLPINTLLKDNADDIAGKILHSLEDPTPHPVVSDIIEHARDITKLFAGRSMFQPLYVPFDELRKHIDFAFIALHGRPGEDGQLQTVLERLGIPYNGSGPASSATTINKFVTNELLMKNGLAAPKHVLVRKSEWQHQPDLALLKVQSTLQLPVIAKPADEGCSSAVKKISTKQQLEAYMHSIFRDDRPIDKLNAKELDLKPNEEFPAKDSFVVEDLVRAVEGERLMEVTVGLLTHYEGGQRRYEVFEPSETLAEDAILSLEEKFLAGEGQNITPARFSSDAALQQRISAAVRAEIERGAQLLDVEGYARIDAFVHMLADGQVRVEFIEINSLPAMTPATCIFHQSALSGYKPIDFIRRIIAYGMARQKALTAIS